MQPPRTGDRPRLTLGQPRQHLPAQRASATQTTPATQTIVIYSKWDWEAGVDRPLLIAQDQTSNNGTKATPTLSADLLGDWREEVVWRTVDGKELRIYTTTLPTKHRLTMLMHDPQYRVAVAWQNVAYNQPTHPSFQLDESAPLPPPSKIATVKPRK